MSLADYETVPACLGPFSVTGRSIEKDAHTVFADYAVRCGQCESESFLAAGLNYGEKFKLFGVRLTCVQCGKEDMVFDGSRNGYDGINGHYDFVRKEPSDFVPLHNRDGTHRFKRLIAVFTYNTDIDELKEMADELGKPLVDFFDWFQLASDDEPEPYPADAHYLIDFECA